jgi:hypothetical protein
VYIHVFSSQAAVGGGGGGGGSKTERDVRLDALEARMLLLWFAVVAFLCLLLLLC